jgi:hypothetical protein
MSDKKTMWRSRVAEWRSSGKTVEEFTAGRDFAAGTLRWWSSRLGREDRARAAMPVIQMARVVRRVGAEAAPRRFSGIVIELLDVPARIVIEAGVDRDALATVLEVVRAGGAR